jgi:hypothetical protein
MGSLTDEPGRAEFNTDTSQRPLTEADLELVLFRKTTCSLSENYVCFSRPNSPCSQPLVVSDSNGSVRSQSTHWKVRGPSPPTSNYSAANRCASWRRSARRYGERGRQLRRPYFASFLRRAASLSSWLASPFRLRAMFISRVARSSVMPACCARDLYSAAYFSHCVAVSMGAPNGLCTPVHRDQPGSLQANKHRAARFYPHHHSPEVVTESGQRQGSIKKQNRPLRNPT